MRFLLIADIHFRSPNCLDRRTDPEWYYRNQLVDDLRGRVAREGAFDVILICGDIAFKGAADEFAEAKKWIDELTDACGCDTRRVFVIPGNHDIDRNRITNSRAVQNAQQAILNARDERRADEFRAQVSFGETGRHLMEPLANYNEFAKIFGCQIWPPDHLMWRQDIALEDGVTLRVHGLTSALFCAAYTPLGREERAGDLYLSPMQTVLETGQDVANLVLCHHTPDWFSDYHDVDDHISGRAAIHVFGHEHRRRHHAEENFVRFHCSAVTGPVQERGWEPGYNVLEIDVRGEGETRKLHVEAEFMVWQARPPLFRRTVLSGGSERLVHDLPLPSRRPHLAAPVDGTAPADQERRLAPDPIQTEAATGDPKPPDHEKNDKQKCQAELSCKIGQNILALIKPAWGTGAKVIPFQTTAFYSALRWRIDKKRAFLAFQYEDGFFYLVSLPRIREYGTTSPELSRIPVGLGENCPSEFTIFPALPSPIDISLKNNLPASILMVDRVTGAKVRVNLQL